MLKELFDDWDNDASWSELSQHFIGNEHREEKTDPADAKQAPHSPHPPPGCLLVLLLPFKAVQSSSRQSELYHIRRFVTEGTFVTMSPPEEQPFHAPA